ncbi:hypothetical protein TNCV_4672171 [Trichonephila clavipes]|nr:hypothetical protein TNCV_4672171 [Trichonephila clavipes]
MKEGLIPSSYECPKCNDQHDVTWSAIKAFFEIVPATPNLQHEPVRRCLDALEELEPLAMYQEDPPL